MRAPAFYAMSMVLFNICISGVPENAECSMPMVKHPARTNDVPASERAAILDNEPKVKWLVGFSGNRASIILAEPNPDTYYCVFHVGDYFARFDNVGGQEWVRRLYPLRSFAWSTCGPIKRIRR